MKKLYIFIALLTFANNSNAVSRFDTILKEIIKYQEFEIDSKNNISNIHNDLKTVIMLDKKTLSQSQKKIEHYQDEINRLIDKIYNYLIELKNKKKSGDEFLYFLLKLRFNTLINRAHDLEQSDLFYTTPPP